jgi:hypothetical protein
VADWLLGQGKRGGHVQAGSTYRNEVRLCELQRFVAPIGLERSGLRDEHVRECVRVS